MVKRTLTYITILLIMCSGALAKQPAEKNPESLPEIAAKQFNGSDLRIIRQMSSNNAYTRYLIKYRSGNLNISGIMNVPKGEGPFPVIILNHGYINPKIYTVGRGLKREQDYFARNGFVVIHTDYRDHGLSDKDPQSENSFRLGYVEDVINAVLAVKNSDYPFLDKENIGMLGHSLGGGIAINIMVAKPDLVKAFVLYAPVSADYIDNFNRWIKKGRKDIADKIIETHGTPDTNPEFWENLSAINFLDKVESPVMINHGTNDESCPIIWSDKLYSALKKSNKDAVYYRYAGEKHEFINQWPLFMQRTVKFFHQYL